MNYNVFKHVLDAYQMFIFQPLHVLHVLLGKKPYSQKDEVEVERKMLTLK